MGIYLVVVNGDILGSYVWGCTWLLSMGMYLVVVNGDVLGSCVWGCTW